MRILIVTHYFPPETGAPQARLSGLAAAWAAGGDDVTVLTGMPNHPTGVIPPEYRGAIRRRERRDGYRVLRTWLYATPNEGVARKTIGHLSFMVSSVLLGGRASGPADAVVVSSPTFFSIGAGWLLARLKRARLVVEIRDLWPAIFSELGVLTNRRVIRLLERLELAAYAAADTVIVVSDGFRANLIGRGVPAGKVHTIRNGVCPGEFDPGAPGRIRGCVPGSAPGPATAWCSTPGRTASPRGWPRWPTPPPGWRRGDQVRVRRRGRGQAAAAAPGGRTRAQQRHPAARRAARAGPRAAGRRRHLPGPAARRAAVLFVHPVEDVRVPRGGQAGGGRGGRRGRADPARGGRPVVPPEDSEALAAAIRSLAADPQRRAAMGGRAAATWRSTSTATSSPGSTARSSESSGGQR